MVPNGMWAGEIVTLFRTQPLQFNSFYLPCSSGTSFGRYVLGTWECLTLRSMLIISSGRLYSVAGLSAGWLTRHFHLSWFCPFSILASQVTTWLYSVHRSS